MIVLLLPSQTLQAKLAGAVAATQPVATCVFFDINAQLQQSGQPRLSPKVTTLNNTTAVDIVAAPALVGIRRNIPAVTVHNADSSAVVVTIQVVDSAASTTTILVKQNLNSGDSLNYEHGMGWTFTTPNTAPFTDALPIVKGSGDSTKQFRIEVDGFTTQTTRVMTPPNMDFSLLGSVIGFSAGTALVFAQTSAPTGWTKSTTHNDKALRVVSGTASSGGATAFTSVFGSGKNTGSYALLAADIPAHTHSGGTYAFSVSGFAAGGVSGTYGYGASPIDGVSQSLTGGSLSGASGSIGGGGGHLHSLSLDLQYVDVIIATKD